jgi:hypothetical protein
MDMDTLVEPTTAVGPTAEVGFDVAQLLALLDALPVDGVGVDGRGLLRQVFRVAMAGNGLLLKTVAYLRRTDCYPQADEGLGVKLLMVRELGISHAEANALNRDARNLTEHGPNVLAALCEGRVSARTSHTIGATLAEVADDVKTIRIADPDHVFATIDDQPLEPVATAEAMLLDIAAGRVLHDGHILALARRIRQEMLPEKTEARKRLQEERRTLHLSQLPGYWKLDGVLDEDLGLQLATLIDAACAPPETGDGRSAGQRRHDALREVVGLAARWIDADDEVFDKTGQRAPTIRITIDAETLTAAPGTRNVFPGQRTAAQWAKIGARTELGHTLSPQTVRQIACQATVIGFIFDSATGEVLQGGRRRRLPAATQHDAVFARDGHCRYPGCDRSLRWCQIHHRVPWQYGGLTDVQDLVAVCQHHHHFIESRNQTLIKGPDGIDRIVPLQEALQDFYNRTATNR